MHPRANSMLYAVCCMLYAMRGATYRPVRCATVWCDAERRECSGHGRQVTRLGLMIALFCFPSRLNHTKLFPSLATYARTHTHTHRTPVSHSLLYSGERLTYTGYDVAVLFCGGVCVWGGGLCRILPVYCSAGSQCAHVCVHLEGLNPFLCETRLYRVKRGIPINTRCMRLVRVCLQILT